MNRYHALRRELCLLCAIVVSALATTTPSPVEASFAVAGVSAEAAQRFLESLQRAVAADDPNAVSELVWYPLRVNSKHRSREIHDKKEFIASYAKIFDQEVRAAILAQRFDELFANWQGVMIGSGSVWFGATIEENAAQGRLHVFAVNKGAQKTGRPTTP